MSAAASEYLDQSASELRLHVLRGDLDLDQFTVLKVAMLRRPWIEVNACIIGASHVLRIAVPGEEPLHEILACGAVCATTTPVFTGRAALLAERDHDVAVALSPGRGYRFRSRVATGAEARLALHALQARVDDLTGGSTPNERIGYQTEKAFRKRGGAKAKYAWQGPSDHYRKLTNMDEDPVFFEYFARQMVRAHQPPNGGCWGGG